MLQVCCQLQVTLDDNKQVSRVLVRLLYEGGIALGFTFSFVATGISSIHFIYVHSWLQIVTQVHPYTTQILNALMMKEEAITSITFSSVTEVEIAVSAVPHCLLSSGWLAGVSTVPAVAHTTAAFRSLLDRKMPDCKDQT